MTQVNRRNPKNRLSRREWLQKVSAGSLCLAFAELDGPGLWAAKPTPQRSRLLQQNPFSPDDEAFLEDLEKANFLYFWEQANPETGMVRDRANVRNPDSSVLSSIAATGFGLTALCIGVKRGFISYGEARARALTTLRFLWTKLPEHRGFFYHWANINTGERLWESEVSSVDTAILLCGVLTCREHFRQHPEIADLAYRIYSRIDWTWLSEDTPLLPHGWTPESGFLPYRWDDYSEMMMMYLLGLGSPMHPLKPQAWDAWKRTTFEYDGIRYIGSFAPLFIHQYSQAWFDFRGKRDRYADYFQNSILATDVHTGASAYSLPGSFPIIATISGESRPRIRRMVTPCGAGHLSLGRSMGQLCLARRPVRCPFYLSLPCVYCERSRIDMARGPGAVMDSWMPSIR